MTISVCIPTFNQSKYIRDTIQSVINQTVKPFEIIVFDDCSSDNTLNILQDLQNEIAILKVYRQPVNIGMSRNADACLRAGTGDYIIKLDSDDCLLPHFAEYLAEALLKYPEAGYAHANVQEIDNDSNYLNVRNLFRKPGYQDGNEALKASVNGYRVAANIIMFRRTALAKVGYIRAKINFADDYYLSVDLAASGFGNVYVKKILSQYRVWTDENNVRPKRKLAELIGVRKVFEEVLEPSFNARGWDNAKIIKRRADFACGQAVCLSWPLFTPNEKASLLEELLQLSSSFRTRLTCWFYLNKMGSIITLFSMIVSFLKRLVKMMR